MASKTTSVVPLTLRARDAAALLGISVTVLREQVNEGNVPAPVRLSPNRVAWRRRDLERWLDELPPEAPALQN